MTSTNDGKDVKSNQTSGPKGKKYHIELYKSLEARLSSEDTLEARTGHVCEAWRHVYSLHQHSASSTHPHLLSWLQRHTALTILQSKWQSALNKDELHNRLSSAIDGLVREASGGCQPWEQALLARARWFRGALASPWGHPVLASLLNAPAEPLADQQVLEWLKEERGVLFVARLKQLAASKQTSDLALTLAGAVMDRARASRPPPADDGDDTADPKEDSTSFYAVLRRDAGFLEVWDLLTDIEFVLLHKQEKRARCIELAKQTPLRDGYQLVERLRSRLETAPRDKKLWKNAKEVATLIAQVIIARCMVVTTCAGAARTALYCCARSLARLLPSGRLPAVTAALAAPAATARHLHTLCSAIHAQCEGGMKPFVCELYVRAITAGMNELERLKLNAEKQAEARSSEQTLATWFLQLGNILGASPRLRAECALTAFSVHPAPDMFERVRQARPPPAATDAQQDKATEPSFNSWANDSRTQSNLVKTSSTLQLKHTPRHANVLSTALLTEGEALGLEPELGQDLAVLLAGPRVKTLSWHMDRELLLENCRAYMDRTHGGTKALTTELKYLNLDLSAFQHLPEEGDDENDAYYGIEKGYEHLVQLEEPEEIWQNAFFDPEQTESADSGPERRGEASSADEDPLSLIAEAKRATSKERKTRDKSKDRTRERRKHKEKKNKKERKKKSDPLDGTDPPKKETKRVRKKKERRREDSVTDHAKEKESVLFDGVFSMDELKSPEKRKSTDNPISTVINSSSPTAINKIISAPIPAFNKSRLEASSQKKSSSSESDGSGARAPLAAPHRLANPHAVNDKVKRSITKLLQFRRNKNNALRTPASPRADGAGQTARGDGPGLHLDNNQTQQLEAMNRLLNTAMEIKNSELRKTPYYNTPEYDKLMGSQSIYNLQKQQEIASHYMSQNMQNAFSDNQKAYYEYLQSSPRKYSNYLQNQPPRPASVMDSNYVSPSKADKYYGLTPPNPENSLSHQAFHKSMQNLSEMDSSKPSQSQSRYYNQYTNKTLEASRHDHAKSSSHLDSRLDSAKPTNLHNSTATSSIQQYPVSTKTKDDYAKTIKTITDRISQSRSSTHNTQPSSNFSSSKHLSSSMHNVNESLTVRSDISRTYSAQTKLMNHYNEVSKASRDIPATNAKPKPQQSSIQHSNKDKTCTIRNPPPKPETAKTTSQIPEDKTQSSFKEFLKELQDTINAGVSDNGNYESLSLNNQVKVTPLNPAAQTKTDATCAKQTKPQKKTETAPNTFSRLSYMHKNKQSEIKNKESDLTLLNKDILDHKISKAKLIKNEVTISRVPKQSPVKNAVQCSPQKHNHPVLSSMLNSSSPVDPYKGMRQSSAVATPSQSSDSVNREHADLLLLLRNQQTLLPNRVPSNDVDTLKHNVCNTQTKDTPVPATYQRSEDNYVINKKVEPVIVYNPQIPKESTIKVDKQQQDWESVMNALRQHKTQPLGPNALDMALENNKKSSQSTPKSYASHMQKPSSSFSQNDEIKKNERSTSRSHTPKPIIRKEGTPKDQNRTEATKKKPQETPKTKETPNKHFTNNPVKQDDPFISGIPNSDYDLLEELMDDDLRQEIGELSSDEERYQAQTVPKVKGAIPKTHICTKISDPPKAKPPVEPTVCKNANLNVPDMKTMVNAAPTGYPSVIINPVLPEPRPENRPTVVCTNIPQRIPNTQHAVPNMSPNPGNQIPQPIPNTQHMVPNMIQNPGNQYVASIPSNHMEGANLILTQIPAQPMVLISQELIYDPYPTIRIQESQVSAGLCSVAPNFVTINPTPNIAVYQTTQFAAPVINPVFIGNAMTSTNVTEQQQNVSPQQEQCPVENLPNPVTNTAQDPVVPEKMNSDINMNKCSERKVLSQMQDNNSLGATEKDVHIRRSSVDKSPLTSNEDEERIKLKRQALINREIDHACFHPPIPLSYTPLSKKLNLEKLLDEPKNGAVKSTFKLRSSSTVANKDVVSKPNVEKTQSNNENIKRTETSSTKENQKKPRVFHRSFSKSKTTNRKFTRVPLRRSKLKTTIIKKVAENASEVDEDKTKTETKTPTRISKRTMNKSSPKVDITKSSSTLDNVNGVQKNIETSNQDKLDSEKPTLNLEKIPVPEQVNASLEKSTADLEKIPISDSSISTNALSGSEVSTVSSKPTQEAVKEVSPNKDNKLATEILPFFHEKLEASREKHVIPKELTQIASANVSEPAETAEKVANNISVKIPASNRPPKEPILMTIKNQNQAILSNASTTNNISKRVQNKVNNVVPKTVQTALPKPVSTNPDKTKLLKTTMEDSSNQTINTKIVNQDKDVNLASTKGNEVQAKKQRKIPINSIPVNSKCLLKPIETTDKIAVNVTTPAKPIENRHVVVMNSKTDNPVKEISTTQGNSGSQPKPQVLNTTRDHETQASPSMSIPEPIKPKNKDIINSKRIDDPKATNQVLNTKSTQAQKDKSILNDYTKDDVIIEEVPIPNNTDPAKKCVRVKLPNGKVFKATVRGKMNVDYDTLFADPAMRSVLKEGLIDGKRYTLNIKQVSKTVKDNPSKIIDTKIREINIKEKITPIDTVNLISDDEEDDTRLFSTEFGKFPTNMDLETVNKHQKRLDQKCIVKLTRDDIFKSNRTKPKPKSFPSTPISLLTRTKSKFVAEMQNNSITTQEPAPTINLQSEQNNVPVVNLATKPLNKETAKTLPTDPEIIEIDDSSSDCEAIPEPVKKITELKGMLLKDLGVVDNTKDEPIMILPGKELVVDNLKCALLEDLGVCLPPAKQPEHQNVVTENKQKSTNHTKQPEKRNTVTCKNITVKNCVVKVTKCEELIKKYELMRNAKQCFVKLQRCNISSGIVNTEVSKSDIMEPRFDCNEDIIDFDIEETSSPQLSRCPSLSILNNLWDDSCLQYPESLYGRSSPVMEIFDALVFLRDKSEDKIKLSKTTETLKLCICDTEWTMTKHEYSAREMYEKTALKESEPEYSVGKLETFTVPRLITIVLKFLENHSDLVCRMHSVHIMKTKSLINTQSNNLKRKPEQLENNIACKMLKLGTLVINAINTYSEKTLRALTVNSFKEETTIKPDFTLDRKRNEYENSDIECNHIDSLYKEAIVIDEQDVFLRTQKRENVDTSVENIENNEKSTENIEGCDVVLTNETLENKTDSMEKGETVTCNDCSDDQTNAHQNCNVPDVIASLSVPKELCEEAINAEYNGDEEIVDNLKEPMCGEVPHSSNEINDSCSPFQIEPLDTVVNEEKSTPVEELQNTEIMQKTTDSHTMNSENNDDNIVIKDIPGNNSEIDTTNTEREISITPQQCETKEDSIEHRVIIHDTENPEDKEPTQMKSSDLKEEITSAVITNPQDISSEIQNTDNSAEKELEKIEHAIANDESANVSEIKILPSNNADQSVKEETDSDVKNDATLVEIPICDLHNEVCEVEIRDTDLEDNIEIQFPTTLEDPENMNTDAVTAAQNDSSSDSIASPDFIDNKQIIFNYHDYTQNPKPKTDTKIENVIKSKPERKYELIQEDDLLTVITTEHDDDPTEQNEVASPIEKANEVFEENVMSPDTENGAVTITGVEIDDPVIGTCYVFTLNESGSTEGSNVSIENIDQESSDENRTVNSALYKDLHDIEFCVIAPKVTYSRGDLKRKMDMRDIKVKAKKYRKGKNIDCSKQTVTSIIESAYSKEYKRLLEYCSSVKFSYSRPFHKEFIDVEGLTANWPINKTYNHVPQDRPDENLFVDVQITPPYQPDPATQTLVQEITHEYMKTDALPQNLTVEAHETNFDMGFGEGSGRVIQNLKKGGGSNISAATLSDVKQTQPAFMSEDHNCAVLATVDDQIKKIRQYVSFIELRDKVRSFFKKTKAELTLEQQDIKESEFKSRWSGRMEFPYDLCSLDYVRPPPTDATVQVVQLGQLPVSAAAQNPVTCDPRVTQVSDASPSQCSVDNSPNDDSQSGIKTEYTELTTADITLPMVQEYAQQNQTMNMDCHEANELQLTEQTISLEMEIKAEERPEIKEELPEIKEEGNNSEDNGDLHTLTNATPENIEYLYDNNTAKPDSDNVYESSELNSEAFSQQRQQNGSTEKTDQIAHAMNAAGITTMSESLNNSRAHALVNILSQKIRQGAVNTTQTTTNTYSKTTSINAMSLQQALAQILPPPLNQTGTNDNQGPQVVHIVQGKNAAGNQITLVDNTPQSVISTPNATQVLHIVQNKGATAGQTSNSNLAQQPNSFSGISLVDAGLQQGGNQLLHIVNTGNQKNANAAGQLLKRVNLLTNLANVQGSNEQKMVQFVCKSADGKAIQLNAPHQRSMVLRLQPIETSNVQTPAKPVESQDLSSSPTNSSNKDSANQQEIKSRSIYEENYAKFIQNSSAKTPNAEKSTSLPKFNQAFGKAVFQEGQKPTEGASNNNAHLATVNTENQECAATDNAMNLEAMRQISSPPLLIRKPVVTTTQSPSNIVQQIKQTIAPMNIQTMHGGVIYTRQIPVNFGGGQTINLISVPSTELMNDESKPQTVNQSESEPSIIKIVPQNQNTSNTEGSQEENNTHTNANSETAPTPQPQPVLTQMRIKLPMLSKAPQMVPGARVVRPSFFQIQRNVIGGANQPVYQQLVLTAAPPLGQQTIRLPQAQAVRPVKVPSESQSSESQMSSSTLEQLREFDMVLEQVKERSTVQPGTTPNNSSFKLQNNSSDATDGNSSSNCSSEPTQVLYSIGSNQSLNVAYVNRKATVTTPTTSTFVRSPDSTGIADSPTSSTHSHIPHTVTSDSSPTEMSSQSKPAKVSSKSKSRPKSSSNPPNTLKLNSVPPKTSSQKPLEDEQTTQRILYILAEYKEQVENSPDKDKPAPRRRSNPPSNPGSSKRKKSSSSRRSGTRDMSPVHGEDTCRTMGSEDSSCGTSQGDCNESCLDSHSPQDSPRKVARKITFDQEIPATQTRPPQRNVIVADGQTITVARSATGKPATAVLMPANYILPVSMVKGGQQIAIVTNRGPKLLTVGGGEAGAANALLLQRLIGPGGLKPVLARPGVRHVRLPTTALHNLQAFNLATATVQPPDSTASPTPGPTPPELVDTRATSSPWTDREDVKPERGSSPEGSEPWNLPSSADAHEYTYEETVRTDNMERTVLDPVPGRYSPDMEAQRIFDKMFDVEKRSYVDSPRCAYDIDSTDGDDKAYQVVQKKDGTHRQHRLSHVSAAALRHKYAILEHELRLQKSLSEECEDLGVDSPSASELFPEAELLFAASPAPDHEHGPQAHQNSIPQPDLDDQIATDQLLARDAALDGAPLDHEEFARAHPNTTFTSEPEAEVQPFTITGLKGRHITSTIFHSNSAPATVLMAAPTVIAQPEHKYEVEGLDMPHEPTALKDDGLTRYDAILTDSRELHLANTASAIVHAPGNATQVIRRVCYEDDKQRDARYLIDEPDNLIAGDDAKMVADDANSRDAALESIADVDDDHSSPERHAELFWESNSASERSESRRPLDFSSDSDKCCKSPFDETNSTDSSGVGAHMRLDTVIKEARARERSGSAGSDEQRPLRTYPPKRAHIDESVSGKTRAGERSPDGNVRRRASGRGVVKRGCHCCSGEPLPARAKKPRQRKPTLDFTN